MWSIESGINITAGAKMSADFKLPAMGERLESKQLGCIRVLSGYLPVQIVSREPACIERKLVFVIHRV